MRAHVTLPRGGMRHMPHYQEGKGNESTVPGGGGAMIAHAKFPGGKGAMRVHAKLPGGSNESTCHINRRMGGGL